MSFLSRANVLYQHSFDTHPTRTLIASNGFLTTLADAIAQYSQAYMERRKNPEYKMHYDFPRTARFAVFGMSMGPFVGKWLKMLDKGFPMPKGGSGMVVAKRVLCDQVVLAPIGLAVFTGSMGLMEAKSQAEIKEKFQDVYWQALKANYAVWPLVQAVNFSIVPLHLRLPFQSTAGIVWNTYLSLLNAKQDEKLDRERELGVNP